MFHFFKSIYSKYMSGAEATGATPSNKQKEEEKLLQVEICYYFTSGAVQKFNYPVERSNKHDFSTVFSEGTKVLTIKHQGSSYFLNVQNIDFITCDYTEFSKEEEKGED